MRRRKKEKEATHKVGSRDWGEGGRPRDWLSLFAAWGVGWLAASRAV